PRAGVEKGVGVVPTRPVRTRTVGPRTVGPRTVRTRSIGPWTVRSRPVRPRILEGVGESWTVGPGSVGPGPIWPRSVRPLRIRRLAAGVLTPRTDGIRAHGYLRRLLWRESTVTEPRG